MIKLPEPGHRVVVRYLLPSGQATDALGELLSADATTVVVDGKRGIERIAVGDIIAAKEVPPAPTRRPERSRVVIRMCVLLWAHEGREQDLHRYEDAVLALLDDHDGRVVVRDRVERRSPDDPTEVQILEVGSQAAIDAYMTDPRRIALTPERDAAIARTQILNLA